jgi:pimeloyl-ACP methyl ester carboxylesterase
MFTRLERDLSRLADLAVVQGRVSQTPDRLDPLVVVLQGRGPEETVDYYVLARPGPYFFAVPAGSYRIAVFADRNRDLAYQPESEPAVYYGDGAEIALATGQRRDGLDIELDGGRTRPIDLAVGKLTERSRGVSQLPDIHLGTIASLADPRFSPENAQLGLWEPVRFVFEVGAGVYFLEEYDPAKVPVLFVHGALGTPRDFAFLISRLDRSRFQPWLVYYPTALDLAGTARAINRVMVRLYARFEFSRIAVVAHSMGGLVARAALNQAVEDVSGYRLVSVPIFVTISTPWNGQVMAGLGAAHAPVPAPSWISMTPGSPFLRALPKTHLPPETRYHLFFSYRGDSALIGETNDEVVAVSSELPLALQREATTVLGFDEDHQSILRSEEVSDALDRILDAIE